MKNDPAPSEYDAISQAGLLFFGKVSASIAHEIKNVLAIINENTGLLEDLSFAAQRGSNIEPERLNKACQQFTKQIQRANDIMKNMSLFAHSVDTFKAQIDLHSLTELVVNLAGRLAAMRKLSLKVAVPSTPVVFTGNPFLLQNTIWQALEFAFKVTNSGGTLVFTPGKDDGGITLRMDGMDNLDNNFADLMPAGWENLLSTLGANVSADCGAKALILRLA